MGELKKKNGRPRKKIDYNILENLCRIQATGEECASVLGMHYSTLTENLVRDGHGSFPEYLKKHSEVGKASLRRMQWKNAESGNTTMQIWLGKQYLKQSDKLEHSGDQDKPINNVLEIRYVDADTDKD